MCSRPTILSSAGECENLDKDKLIGFLLVITSIVGILAYGWLLFFTQMTILILQLTAFIVIAILLAILVWVGYTLMTIPPARFIEDTEKVGEERN